MNFTNYFKRSNFVELDRFPSKINSAQQQRARVCRDPFEGDPFKIQSLNFRYADKPTFYPVSSRGKGITVAESTKSDVKNIYYNHDHTIPKCDKENLSIQSVGPCRPISTTPKLRNHPKPSATSEASMSQQVNSTTSSVDSGLSSRKISGSKSFIWQPTASRSQSLFQSQTQTQASCVVKRPLRPSNSNLMNPIANVNLGNAGPTTGIDVDHPGGCHITIKINGVPRNAVHISKTDGNVEINLMKSKRQKKTKSPKSIAPTSPKAIPPRNSPHEVKPSRSYVIHRDENRSPTPQRSSASSKVLKESSTHSMIPHREEKSSRELTDKTPSNTSATRRLSDTRIKNLSRNFSQMAIPAANTNANRATMLERILSHNPIVMPQQTPTKVLFSKSKTFVGQRASATAIPVRNVLFDKILRKPY